MRTFLPRNVACTDRGLKSSVQLDIASVRLQGGTTTAGNLETAVKLSLITFVSMYTTITPCPGLQDAP